MEQALQLRSSVFGGFPVGLIRPVGQAICWRAAVEALVAAIIKRFAITKRRGTSCINYEFDWSIIHNLLNKPYLITL